MIEATVSIDGEASIDVEYEVSIGKNNRSKAT